jgi:hypothetical protein
MSNPFHSAQIFWNAIKNRWNEDARNEGAALARTN